MYLESGFPQMFSHNCDPQNGITWYVPGQTFFGQQTCILVAMVPWNEDHYKIPKNLVFCLCLNTDWQKFFHTLLLGTHLLKTQKSPYFWQGECPPNCITLLWRPTRTNTTTSESKSPQKWMFPSFWVKTVPQKW